MLGHERIVAAPTKEALYVSQLCEMLEFKKQYSVEKYRLDMYPDTRGTTPSRTETINTVLGDPMWIRFNPDEPGFSIVPVILS